MNEEANDFYAVLGVPADADAVAVRAAYLALVRKHPPEREPDRFAEIAAAYAVLGNAEKRSAFDAFRGVPTEVREGMRAAFAAVEQGESARAADLLESLRRAFPEQRGVIMLLAQLRIGLNDLPAARETLAPLVARNPLDCEAAYLLACAHHSDEDGDSGEAERILKHVLTIEPDHLPPLIGLARLLLRSERAERALRDLAAAELAPGRTPANILHLRAEVLRAVRFAPEAGDADEAFARLVEALDPADHAQREEAQSILWTFANHFVEESRHDLAYALLGDAERLAPGNPQIAARRAALAPAAKYAEECSAALLDPSCPPWMKSIIVALRCRERFPKRRRLLRNVIATLSKRGEAFAAFRDAALSRYRGVCASILGLEFEAFCALSLAPTNPEAAQLLVDPDVPGWIKEATAAFLTPHRQRDRSETLEMLHAGLKGEWEARFAELSAAIAKYPSVKYALLQPLHRLRWSATDPRPAAAVLPSGSPPREKLGVLLGSIRVAFLIFLCLQALNVISKIFSST